MSSKRVSNDQTNVTSKKLKLNEEEHSNCKIDNDTFQVDAQQRERKVDFITRVPYDVLCIIASLLNTEALDECIHTNLAWRNVISQCPAFWRRVELNRFKGTPVLYMLPKVAQHIRELRVNVLQGSVAKIFQVMEMGYFSNLQSLDIALCMQEQRQLLLESHSAYSMRTPPSKKSPVVVYGTICRFLPYVASTLTNLRLWLCNYRDAPPLRKILSICRNLESLTYWCKSTSALTDLCMPHTTSLTRVSLSPGTDGVISQENLRGLLQCSPNIRWLSVEGCPYDALSIIHQFSLQLEYLSINCESGRLHRVFDPASYIPDEYRGLRCLIMMDSRQSSRTLLPFLQRHQHSIEELYLSGINRYIGVGDDMDDSHGSDMLQDFPIMTNLTTVYIQSNNGADYWKATLRFLHNCPNIHTLELADPWKSHVVIPNHLVDALTGIKALATLKLLYAHLDSPLILRLLKNYATIHSDKSPSNLELYYCFVPKEDWSGIMSISSCIKLKALRVYGTSPSFRTDTISHILYQAVGNMSQVEYNFIDEDYPKKGAATLRDRPPLIRVESYNWYRGRNGYPL